MFISRYIFIIHLLNIIIYCTDKSIKQFKLRVTLSLNHLIATTTYCKLSVLILKFFIKVKNLIRLKYSHFCSQISNVLGQIFFFFYYCSLLQFSEISQIINGKKIDSIIISYAFYNFLFQLLL